MNYYKFHIGDYKAHTSHLEPLEDLAYRRMLDWQYLHESPLPADIEQISRLVGLRNHADAVASVVAEFYLSSSDGFTNRRVQKDLSAIYEKSEKARNAAKKSWSNRKNANV